MSKPDLLQIGVLPEWVEHQLAQSFNVHRLIETPKRAGDLAELGQYIRVIATRGDLGARSEIIAACPALEMISIYGVGYDAVDLDSCRVRSIKVTNTPDVLTDDCADLAVGMWLALSRGIVAAERHTRSGDWATKGGFPLQHKASGKRAGILGAGRIGQAIGRRLQGFDMDIAYSARRPRGELPWQFIADAAALAEWADVLFVTLAATADTYHIVSKKVISALGSEGLLVNISRAQNVDEKALLCALESGSLRGAALDVFEGEPKLDPRFTTLPNALLQPHHASGTHETRRAMGQLMIANLNAHFMGKPLLTPVV